MSPKMKAFVYIAQLHDIYEISYRIWTPGTSNTSWQIEYIHSKTPTPRNLSFPIESAATATTPTRKRTNERKKNNANQKRKQQSSIQ